MKAAQTLDTFYRSELGLDGLVPLHTPTLAGREWEYLKECLDSGWVSTAGSFVERFEGLVAERSGTRFAVATVNGTAALHAAFVALGVAADDAVLCPALTFAATANAITYCAAVPLFLDAEWATLGISPHALTRFLETDCRRHDGNVIHSGSGRRIAAIVPVHVFGQPVDMTPLMEICDKFGIAVVEDATEALGSRYNGRPCGAIGRLGAISFNGNKVITCGGGGMLVTDDEDLAGRLRHLTTTARVAHRWEFDHDEVGYNYRMPNVNAALGCAQLEQLDGFLVRKKRLAERYAALFDGSEAAFFEGRFSAETNHWLNAVVLADAVERDAFLEATHELGIQTRPCWNLLPDLPPFSACPRADGLDVARDIVARTVTIPSSPWMLTDEGAVAR